MKLKISHRISETSRKNDENREFKEPFNNYLFLALLEESKSVGEKSGWSPHYFENDNYFCPSYVKVHSYGEYIFDWAWADFYERSGLSYYPKLISAIPFTPVNSNKVLNRNENIDKRLDFLQEVKDVYLNNNLSSHHYLFTDPSLNSELSELNYFKKYSIQYHFFNHWLNYEDFLISLKSRKRKQIKKERNTVKDFITKNNLVIKKKKSSELTINELERIYDLYLQTIDKKRSYPYLTKDFFLKLNSLENSFFFLLYSNENIEAMSLFFESETHLYGRYWGASSSVTASCQYMHFELCYYLGIEYVTKNRLTTFEAGAQGEHKLLRGFRAVPITSMHHIKDHYASQIIKEHTLEQNKHILKQIEALNLYLPFKTP